LKVNLLNKLASTPQDKPQPFTSTFAAADAMNPFLLSEKPVALRTEVFSHQQDTPCFASRHQHTRPESKQRGESRATPPAAIYNPSPAAAVEMLAITSERRSSWVQHPSRLYRANEEKEGRRVLWSEVGLGGEQAMVEEGVGLKGRQ